MPRSFSLCLLALAGWAAFPLLAQPVGEGVVLRGTLSSQALLGRDADTSWFTGGPGRLPVDHDDTNWFGEARLELEWRPRRAFGVAIWGLARSEAYDVGEDFGIGEAKMFGTFALGNAWQLNYTAGHYFPPTSMENTDPTWRSPYTRRFSVVNSWIGEEVRHTGVALALDREWGDQNSWLVEGSLLRGNDTQGTLLAWRGASISHRVSLYQEWLPLPALGSIRPGGVFALQDQRGTQPFGKELDDRWGWSARSAFEWRGRLYFQAQLNDNRGDRRLAGTQYVWETRYTHLGFSWDPDPSRNWTWLAEWINGESGMGDRTGAHVQIDFTLAYTLLSYRSPNRRWRFSARYDRVDIVDLDRKRLPVNPDAGDEDGNATTVSVVFHWRPNLQLDIEYNTASFERARLDNGPLQSDGAALGLGVLYRF